jgi:hypothetical protein
LLNVLVQIANKIGLRKKKTAQQKQLFLGDGHFNLSMHEEQNMEFNHSLNEQGSGFKGMFQISTNRGAIKLCYTETAMISAQRSAY